MKIFELLQTIHVAEIGLTLALVIVFSIFKKIAKRFIRNHANQHDLSEPRTKYIVKIIKFALTAVMLILISLVWEISFSGISIYITSIFAVIGVAMFATWSILSNITAYVILFFYFPFKIGSKIEIIDGDNSVIGIVEDITFFFIKIRGLNDDELDTSNNIVTYPNNLAMQKAIKVIE
jgi:small-conductance mechanosensitive channel